MYEYTETAADVTLAQAKIQQKNRAKARFFYILRTALDNSAQSVYNYDSTDLRSVTVTAVTADGVETTYTYDANGNRTSQTTGAVTTTYTYNKANLVTGMVNTLLNDDGEDVVISEFAYTYYADGNQRTKTETLLGGDLVTTTYVYDGLGRLTAETKGEDSITYTYDANGNRIGMNRNGTVTAYAYDANNRLLSETVNGETTAYTYDANGNTLTAGDKTYTYNDRGQQTGYSNGTTAAAYAYNPSGLRKAKTVGGSTKYFVYNGMNIVYEYSESVADGVTYFYGLNRTHNSNGEIYVYNAHGDVVQLVKDNSVVASYTYDAFGNLTSQIGESDNPFLYCGEYYDAETQTYYLRARYYNPANGRFTQQDAWAFMDTPAPLSLNLYTYCCNNPVMYVDPSGHWIHLAIGAAIGGLVAATVSVVGQLIENKGDFSKIDGVKVLTATVAGAVSGLVASTGVGLVGQIAINAGLSAANSFADQTYEIYCDDYTRDEYNLFEIGTAAAVGGVAGLIGGAGAGNNAMNSLSNQLVKRVENAVNYYIGKGATKEIQKAIIYYAKSANKMVMNEIVKSIIKAGGVSLAYTIVSSTDLDEKIKSALVKYVDSYNEAQLLYE